MASAGGEGGGSGRAPRLPRWTRQEILVLIEGKKVVEGRGRGRRGGGGGAGGGAAEPTKWAAVAEYCRRHGLERGPVQCRKRWSNLAGDYKKIREWERSVNSPAAAGGGKEVSFWAMRNDARRERRLPGFFDREVYDILEGRAGNAAAAAAGKEEEEKVFDSSRRAGGGAGDGDDGLFSSEEEDDEDEEATPPAAAAPSVTTAAVAAVAPPPAPAAVAVPTSEKKTDPPRQEASEQAGTSRAKQPEQIVEDSPAQGAHKRQRSDDASGEAPDLQGQLIEILDRSSRLVAAQLEAQNINCQLDREQRKDQVSSLLGVLGKVADALYRIADKM
uniref:Myb-like domain-containing protein n=1 Tax=Leersia perrieri TaxID=77586 RepID=A0A0D9W4E1_9ORYZ